ncbi:hypothetical protein [Rhizobium sp. PL01]|uniref:hypothetical protein n=1 Tax=Rhizobium sp. PL01 TaxID=3085631 RepID=UPI00298122DA|nr:hypothetical protein [Rhizobium sp. PL01]MDW5313741.1 hypothetical protein [Rhizobium sp. PL01]
MTRKKNGKVTSADAGDAGLPGLPHGAMDQADNDAGFTILGDADEKDTAEQQPEAGTTSEAPADPAPEAERAVDDVDRDAVEAGAGEHQGEPVGTDLVDTDGGLSDAEEKAEVGAAVATVDGDNGAGEASSGADGVPGSPSEPSTDVTASSENDRGASPRPDDIRIGDAADGGGNSLVGAGSSAHAGAVGVDDGDQPEDLRLADGGSTGRRDYDGDGSTASPTGTRDQVEERGDPAAAGEQRPDQGTGTDGEIIDVKTPIDAGDGSAGISDAPAPVVSEALPDAAAGAGILSAAEAGAGPVDGADGTAEPAGEANAPAAVATLEEIATADAPVEIFKVASYAALSAYNGAAHYAYLSGQGDLRDEDFLDRIEREELGKLVLQIRERATPAVLAQQRVISRLRQNADLNRPEEIGLKIFASVILELDAYDREETARLEARQAPPVERPLTPIEDTVMEPLDDVMGGW